MEGERRGVSESLEDGRDGVPVMVGSGGTDPGPSRFGLLGMAGKDGRDDRVANARIMSVVAACSFFALAATPATPVIPGMLL